MKGWIVSSKPVQKSLQASSPEHNMGKHGNLEYGPHADGMNKDYRSK